MTDATTENYKARFLRLLEKNDLPYAGATPEAVEEKLLAAFHQLIDKKKYVRKNSFGLNHSKTYFHDTPERYGSELLNMQIPSQRSVHFASQDIVYADPRVVPATNVMTDEIKEAEAKRAQEMEIFKNLYAQTMERADKLGEMLAGFGIGGFCRTEAVSKEFGRNHSFSMGFAEHHLKKSAGEIAYLMQRQTKSLSEVMESRWVEPEITRAANPITR